MKQIMEASWTAKRIVANEGGGAYIIKEKHKKGRTIAIIKCTPFEKMTTKEQKELDSACGFLLKERLPKTSNRGVVGWEVLHFHIPNPFPSKRDPQATSSSFCSLVVIYSKGVHLMIAMVRPLLCFN